ncbi:hypothetical protein ACQ4PT_011443 [Festuca glaucescens]
MATAADGAAAAHHTGGRDQVVVFPFMAKGHTLPLLHFVTALSVHHKGLRVTVVTTPANLAFARSRVPSSVRFAVLPFPSLPQLPAGVESTDALPSPSLHPTFLQAAALLREPFAELMASLSSPSPPLVLFSDFFLGFTRRVAADAGVRHVVFHGMSCFSMALGKSAMMGPLPSCAGHGDSFQVPRMPAHLKFTAAEVPPCALAKTSNHEDPSTDPLMDQDSEASSWGVLVNSFAKLDEEFVSILESFYQPDARAWLVGPLFLAAGDILQREEQDPEGCLPWLDEQSEPVVYVSFGTQVHVADEQLGELARGLVQSGHPFLWAVRSETWSPPVDVGPHGRVVRGWVPQRSVLEHRAVGGFVSHCGWNSVMESLAAGKPMLAWPMMAEQPVNARHVADIIGAGIRMDVAGSSVVVDRSEVEKKVRRLMDAGGEEGRKMRVRAAWAQQAAKSAVSDGGTSHMALLKLLEELQQSYDCDASVWERDNTEA